MRKRENATLAGLRSRWLGAASAGAALLWCAAAPAALAQPADWGLLGPRGGAVSSLAPVPAGAGAVWAGVAGHGLWRSVDGGVSWVGAPLPAAASFATVAADPIDPLTVYAATGDGVEKSTDAGATWRLVHTGVAVVSLAAAAAAPTALYEVDTGPDFYGGSMLVSKSTDAGATWQQVKLPWPWVNQVSLAVDPTDANRVYVAGKPLIGAPQIVVTADGGATWQELTVPPLSPLPIKLTVDPRDHLVIYANTTAQGELYRSMDGGASWKRADGGLGLSVVSLTGDPGSGSLYALVSGVVSEIWKSIDYSDSWSRVFQGPSPSALVLTLAVDAGLPGRVYAGAQGAGIMSSDDYGDSWRTTNVGLDAVQVIDLTREASAPATLYAVLAAGGAPAAARSDDGGATWAPIEGLHDLHRIVADPYFPGRVYAAAGGDVWTSTDGGRSWRALGVPNANSVEVDPDIPGLLVATRTGSSPDLGTAASISMDVGQTWMPIPQNQFQTADGSLASFSTAAFDAGSPSYGATIYIGGASGLLVTFNGGGTWFQRGQTLPQGQAIVRLRVSRSSDGTVSLYAVLSPGAHTLYRGDAAGSAWTAVDGGLPPGIPVRDLYVGPEGGTLYAGTDAGIYRSPDGGTSWSALNGGLTEPRVTRLLKDPTGPTLYAGTAGGLYVSPPRTPLCSPSDTVLCLLLDRFAAQLTWRLADGTTGSGHARTLADGSGGFWFFSPENTEVFLKMLDGSGVNGHSWLFSGSLSNVGYSLTLTDVSTGDHRTYDNPAGKLSSFTDTQSFRGAPGAQAGSDIWNFGTIGNPPGPTDPCSPTRTVLCLLQGRFRVEIQWQLGGTATPPAMNVPLSQVSGAFWFFGPQALEVVVKILDGRAVDGHFWVFTGGMSSLSYTVVVTDTLTGAQRAYNHPGSDPASEFHPF
jgi:photosystem II stability/assembly factor-like uncharacterized protein